MAAGEVERRASDTVSSPWANGVQRALPPGEPASLLPASALGEEDVAKLLRFRGAFVVASGGWMAYLLLDVVVSRYGGAGPFVYLLFLRLVVLAFVVPLVVRLYRAPQPSPRMLTVIDVIGYALPSAALALMCIPFRCLASPYAPGLCVILVARTITAQDRWRRGLALTGTPVLTFCVVLFGATAFSPALRAQWHDPAVLAALATSAMYVFSVYGFAVVGGHAMWALQRQVFEARNLGGYRLVRPIGRGAHGEVWLARHGALKRDVAVKVLRRDAHDTLGVERFTREAQATSELVHPNTVRVFDFGTTPDGLRYYVMELLEGETLSDLVEREGPLAPGRAANLAAQAARALAEAHARGIVHRDVKPANLFVTQVGGEGDFVKVLDFGVARLPVAGRAAAALTAPGHLIGTPAFMSPEAVRGEEVDARADVYAMGAVLYFMLAGCAPFDADGHRVLAAHLNDIPLPPSVRRGAALPAGLEAIALRCLAKPLGDRYPDAGALAAGLATWSIGSDGSA
ncbi:MAG TPA: serine/threonine-protein kinase [Polyangiaceae bacterium]|jgi:serine/threonine-protein kinase|nr:serine/threonine-protein kinase [Polyangiaceae bacterium]